MKTIEEIAKEAGTIDGPDFDYRAWLIRFAAAVRRDALEAAVQACESKGPELIRWWGDGPANAACQECAAAIRSLQSPTTPEGTA